MMCFPFTRFPIFPIPRFDTFSQKKTTMEITAEMEQEILNTFDQLTKIEESLDSLSSELEVQQATLQHEHDLKAASLYKQRDVLLNGIPSFWLNTMLNHDLISEFLVSEEEDDVAFLTSIKVTRDPKDIYK